MPASTSHQRRTARRRDLLLFAFPARLSPDLNPIEHLWVTFNTRLRKDLATAINPLTFIAEMSQFY